MPFDNESQFNHAAKKVAAWDRLSAARDAFLSACHAEEVAGTFTEHDLSDVKGLLQDSMADLWGSEVSPLKDELDAYEGYEFRDGPQRYMGPRY